MSGKFYSTSVTTSEGDEDILDGIRTTLAALDSPVSLVGATSLELISADNIGVDINNTGIYSTLHLESSLYKLKLDSKEVVASSVKIETSGHTVWIKIVF